MKQIGYIGLEKMGRNMVLRLLEKGWRVVAYNRTKSKTEEVVLRGAEGAETIKEMISKLAAPRTIWLMVSHKAVDEVLTQLVPLLEKGDLVIDGGNSPYHESMKRAVELEEMGIKFLDVGTSGGPGGARNGACMMIGGNPEVFDEFAKTGFFRDTCVDHGFAYLGPAGSGHYVKMVHNGIEYGMMQAIAEGFDLFRHSKEFNFDLKKIVELYENGSVVSSRLISWLADGYKKYGEDLKEISGRASALGEGHWTLETGKNESISMPAIEGAIKTREASQVKPSYQGKVISTMRGEFGGHPVSRGEDEKEVL
jgi:6-phosphogluconate dehydrogenase